MVTRYELHRVQYKEVSINMLTECSTLSQREGITFLIKLLVKYCIWLEESYI